MNMTTGGRAIRRTKNNLLTSKNKGFTLIELLIVLVILGLLAALVTPRIFPKLGKGKQAAAKTQIGLLEQALDQYRLDCGRYPTTQEGIGGLIVGKVAYFNICVSFFCD